MSHLRLNDVRVLKGTQQYFIYEFAGEGELHWAPLAEFIVGRARGLPRPDESALEACAEAEKRAAIEAIKLSNAVAIAAHRAEVLRHMAEHLAE